MEVLDVLKTHWDYLTFIFLRIIMILQALQLWHFSEKTIAFISKVLYNIYLASKSSYAGELIALMKIDSGIID